MIKETSLTIISKDVIDVYNIVIHARQNKLVIVVLQDLLNKLYYLLEELKLIFVPKHVVMEEDFIYNVMMEM